jgi:pentatricopeptide repeat protein
LFGSLNDSSLLKQIIFIKLIQKNWLMKVEREIELKEKVMKIMKDRGVKHTAFSITPMISLYGKIGDTIKADALFEMMIEKGIKRIPSIYNALMKCHWNNKSKIDQIFAWMKEDGIKPDVYTYNSMIKAYSKELDKVERLYFKMTEEGIKPDVCTYSTMINAFSRDLDKVAKLHLEMIEGGIKPDVYTYNSMIKAFSKDLVKVEKLYLEMIEESIEPTVVTYNTMIDVYAKNRELEKAIEVFTSMKRDGMEPNVVTYNTIIDAYAKIGELEKALSIWKYLSGAQSYDSLGMILPVKSLSVSPDAATLSIALDVCKYGRFEKEAHDVWNYGQDNDRVVVDSNVLTSYVECLSSFGEKGANQAVDLILRGIKGEKMPLRCVKPDKKTIEHAIWCLKDHRWKKHAAKLDGIKLEE